jgi:3-hydroxybutyrate dehydrogenase
MPSVTFQRTVSLAEATTEMWDAILAVNLSGAFHTMRRANPDGRARLGHG